MPQPPPRGAAILLCILFLSFSPGCFSLRPSSGGGQTSASGGRKINPADVALPKGYRIKAVARGLTFPTGVTFDDRDRVYVVEAGYSYGEKWTTPRLLRVEDNGSTTCCQSWLEQARFSSPRKLSTTARSRRRALSSSISRILVSRHMQ